MDLSKFNHCRKVSLHESVINIYRAVKDYCDERIDAEELLQIAACSADDISDYMDILEKQGVRLPPYFIHEKDKIN